MKKSVKIGLWVVGVLILALVIIIGPEYKFVKTYPAACWTDDGKQIVYLEHRELRRPMKLKIWGDADDILKSKTYLCIMDANGKNKRVVGVVPDLTDKQKDLMRGGRLPEKEFKEMDNKKNEFFMKNLSKSEVMKLKKGWLVLNEKNPKNEDILFIGTPLNMNTTVMKIIYSDKKEKLLLKSSISKSYLFIPFWWKV